MKKRTIISFLFIFSVVIIFTIFHFTNQPFSMTSSGDSSKTTTVMANKKWILSFSEPFNEDSVTEDAIYVTDKDGERVGVSLSFLGESVTVIPPKDGYNPKKSPFKLHVSSSVESIDGKKLQTGEEIRFHAQAVLPTISSKKELNKLFKERLAKMEKENRRGFFTSQESTSADDSDSSGAAENSSSDGGSDFSETNVQVDGVDEADIVKTDGEYIYQAIDHKLQITKVLPVDDIEVVAVLNYQDFAPSQMFLDGDQLVLIGQHWNDNYEAYQEGRDHSLIMPMYGATRVMVYDISDRTNPIVEKTLTLEGSYVSSRKIKEHVYIIANQYANYWVLRDHPEADIRPRIIEVTGDSEDEMEEEMRRVAYSDIHYFPGSEEDNFMTIASFNLNNPTDDATILTYIGSGQQIYMSKENLYVAVPNYSQANGRNWFNNENTDLYKFSVDGLQVEYTSTGSIPGYLLNQFSMDEYNGYFRVAATKGQTWDEQSPSSNNLFIMDEQLNIISSVEDLARGERIYSVRFIQEKAYVVTFKEVDPLFVFDLSNPNDPRVLGELKIPGFSNYLHPYDENYLIGFGNDTKIEKDQFGTRVVTDGVKISLFDVSDPTNPLEKHTEIIGGRATYSPLNYDHKALLFNKERDIFAFPITIYSEKDKYDYRFEFEGALVYGIDPEKGFTLHTKMTHQKENTPYEDWENTIQRVIYINDHLYAVSPKQITASKITW